MVDKVWEVSVPERLAVGRHSVEANDYERVEVQDSRRTGYCKFMVHGKKL